MSFLGAQNSIALGVQGIIAIDTGTGTPVVVTDPYWANVSMLLHGDGVNGGQNNTFLDGSTNNFTVTRNGNTTQGSFNPFVSTYPYTVATNGGSGYFDGTGDYLSAPSNAAFDLVANDFTIECWIYSTVAGSIQYFAGKSSSAGLANSIIFYKDAANTLSLYVKTSGGVDITATSAATIPLNTWTYVAGVRNGATLRVYINGVQDGTNGSLSTSALATTTEVFGVGATGSFATGRWNGYISNFRLVNGTCLYPSGTTFTPSTVPLTAVTNTSLLLGFTNGAIYDNAELNNLETVGNAQINTTTFKYGTGAIKFDGTGDALAIPANANLSVGTGDFTIEMWVYASTASNSSTVGSGWPCIFTLGTSQGAGSIEAYIVSGTDIWVSISGGAAQFTFAASTLFNSSWNHFAITRSGTALKGFVNGAQVGSAVNSGNINLAATTQSWIAATAASVGNLNGYIDDIRITNGVARYVATFTPPTAAFPNS